MKLRHFISAALSALIIVLAGAVRAEVTICVDLRRSGLGDADKTKFVDGLKAKYAFKVGDTDVGANLKFTTTPPFPAKCHKVIVDNRVTASNFGVNRGKVAKVFRKKLTNGHWRNIFDTAEKQMNSMIDTGAHELAHQFLHGHGHNWHGPDERTESTDVKGVKHVRSRDVGGNTGNLANGKPGLMARGSKVTPEEHAVGGLEFTDDEKKKIADAVAKVMAGKNPWPKAGGAKEEEGRAERYQVHKRTEIRP